MMFLIKRQDGGLQKGVDRLGRTIDPGRCLLVGVGKKGSGQGVQGRINCQGQPPDQDRKGIDIAGQRQAEPGADQQKTQEVEFKGTVPSFPHLPTR